MQTPPKAQSSRVGRALGASEFGAHRRQRLPVSRPIFERSRHVPEFQRSCPTDRVLNNSDSLLTEEIGLRLPAIKILSGCVRALSSRVDNVFGAALPRMTKSRANTGIQG